VASLLRFAFGVHFHQPVGNFDHVFEQHVRDVYRPFLERMAEREFFPIAIHISGPLIEWLEAHEPAFLDRIARLAADDRVELLLSGFYEPVLVALPREDRVEQIRWMHQAIKRRFGVEATGLWLTERVWEPELAADLARAGVDYVLVDDRHFLVSGFTPDRLHAPFWTESDGERVALFPIDERLRYLIPFKPPADTVAYLRLLRERGARLAVLADDGEKFGGWPGTKEWVYERGWLAQFLEAMGALVAGGEVRLTTFAAALAEVPSGGLAYLPTASYREMEGWALPAEAAARLARLERELGAERMAGPDGALIRGAHWRNFLVRYPEANRMHKKMQALSLLCRQRGDPAEPRRAIGRAQCNDAYWHGVFGGLYLPHLRRAVWHSLAVAEQELRRKEPLAVEKLDLDGDGVDEIWIHSSVFSVLVSPCRGGVIEEFTLFGARKNYADVLTRRREVYHEVARGGGETESASVRPGDGTPSIHEIEKGVRLDRRPPVDRDARAMLVDRVLRGDLTYDVYAGGEYDPIASWAGAPAEADIRTQGEFVEVICRARGLEKTIRCNAAGGLTVSYRWDPAAFPGDAVFAPEISFAHALELKCSPAADVWSFPIATVSKSERGLDQTVQGTSLTPRWPASLGQARLELIAGP
jgi:4-alpha-glucanotransferase